MAYDHDLFLSYIDRKQSSVKLDDGTSVKVVGKGDVNITITVNGEPFQCKLLNVLHVPYIGYQLLSVPTLDRQTFEVNFKFRRCYIKKENALSATATMTGNLYEPKKRQTKLQERLSCRPSTLARAIGSCEPCGHYIDDEGW